MPNIFFADGIGKLEKYGVIINPTKCELGVTRLQSWASSGQGWHTALEGESNSSPEFSIARHFMSS